MVNTRVLFMVNTRVLFMVNMGVLFMVNMGVLFMVNMGVLFMVNMGVLFMVNMGILSGFHIKGQMSWGTLVKEMDAEIKARIHGAGLAQGRAEASDEF
jgi:hypothetical protein